MMTFEVPKTPLIPDSMTIHNPWPPPSASATAASLAETESANYYKMAEEAYLFTERVQCLETDRLQNHE